MSRDEADEARVEPNLRAARALAAKGDDAAARQCYLDALRLDPDCVDALVEVAVLAGSGGYRRAARTAFLRAIELQPGNHIARVGLGNLMVEDGEHVDAQRQYRLALTVAPGFAPAHQGLARSLSACGDPDAEPHFRAGFNGHSVVRERYRGAGTGIPLLLLVSARGGNVPLRPLIDNRIFAVTAVYADFVDPSEPLSRHAITVNAIGDADLCGDALAGARRIIAGEATTVINHPDRVRPTRRENNARRLASVPGVIAPRIRPLIRGESPPRGTQFPVLLRSPGFHTGQHFVLAESQEQLEEAAAELPGTELLLVDYLNCRGTDGMARKYRVMFVDGAIYPLHLAIGASWKVHYFTSAMATNAAFRAEEQRFLADMPGVLGKRAMAALADVCEVLDLDYAGVDFAVAPDGSLLLFEANATMVIDPPDACPIWDYRRPSIAAAQNAVRKMLWQRARRTWHR